MLGLKNAFFNDGEKIEKQEFYTILGYLFYFESPCFMRDLMEYWSVIFFRTFMLNLHKN